MDAKFILSKKVVKEQVKILEDLGLKISYSYKTNRIVGDVMQSLEGCENVNFSIHAKEEIDKIEDKAGIWFFTQAESVEELIWIIKKGVNNFVIDNEVDLERILDAINREGIKINLSLRMKFMEHRIGSGKYFVYGMDSRKVNELIEKLRDNKNIKKLGLHIHRKSQNVSEWGIVEDLKDSISEENFGKIDFVNFGGGLPSIYKSLRKEVFDYVLGKLKEAKEFLDKFRIVSYIEPGRFIAAPSVKLQTNIIQIYGGNIVVNTTIYNCALDTVLTNTKMLVEGELGNEEGRNYLIKGNSPTRDDIFRYKVKLKNPQVGDKILFLNAGAYNYTTDFFGHKKLETEIVKEF